MTCERSVIAAIVFLGLGLGLILGYCHDSTISFSAAHPASAATLRFVIYTNALARDGRPRRNGGRHPSSFCGAGVRGSGADCAAWQRTARECFRSRETLTLAFDSASRLT